MRKPFVTVAAGLALTLGIAAPICAQSLAAIAQKEEDRRKNIKQPAKVYTNQDLGPALPGSVSAAPADAKDSGKDSTAKDSAKDSKDADKTKDGDKAKDDKAKGQTYWHDRMQGLQAQADRDQTYLEAVQTRINALTTDFVNRDDPAQKANIERERQRNLGELDKLKKAVLDDKKAIADLEDEARRAGVPPGWLR